MRSQSAPLRGQPAAPFPQGNRGWGPTGRGWFTGELRKSTGVLSDLQRPLIRLDWMATQTWDSDSEVSDEVPVVKRKPKILPPRRRWSKALAVLIIAFIGASSVSWLLLGQGIEPAQVSDFLGRRWKDESPDHFTFAVAADFGQPPDPESTATAARARAAGVSFLIALGDFGFPNEAAWCRDVRRFVPEVVLVAGDFEDGPNGNQRASDFAQSCPYTLSSPYVPGNGTLGYGYDYYFDYPSATPLARFVMISAGLTGGIGYNYSKKSPHTEWMEDLVQDARDRNIPWVIVGVHKQCITVGTMRNCSMGQETFDELVEAGVDLILVGHDHVYERSKPLDESEGCDSVNATNQFVASCVMPQPAPNTYEKGRGTVVVVQGVGGLALDNVTIDGSDPEIGYFREVMGQNANTEARLPGFGSVLYNVSTDSITARTDFCPAGRLASNGGCLANPDSVFTDRFAIADPKASVFFPLITPLAAGSVSPIDGPAAQAPPPDGMRVCCEMPRAPRFIGDAKGVPTGKDDRTYSPGTSVD